MALALLAGTALWRPAAARALGDDLLPADAAFRLVSARRENNTVVVTWLIASGYYLYRDRLHFHATRPADVRLRAPLLPQALSQAEPGLGSAAVYRGALQAVLRWDSAIAPSQITVGYQGCADAGFCYPPQTRVLSVASAS